MEIAKESIGQPTLLFIPDISGYTEFINSTEIAHSKHIIEELLEELIDANEIGLEISEIEGDAILFYRMGKPPTAAEILAQAQKMYEKFHAHLKKYELLRICQCGACANANNLALKFILHFGEVSHKQVKVFSKLFGKDLIVAHRLMKNSIQHDEYALITHQLLNACSTWVEINQIAWEEPIQGKAQYDFGDVEYCYIPLEPLKALVPDPTVKDFALSDKMMHILEVEYVINAPIDLVFDVAFDPANKHLWWVGVTDSDKLNSKISRNGSTHRCVMGGGEKDPYFTSHSFKGSKDLITWTDTDYRTHTNAIFQLKRIGNQLTRVTITMMTSQNPIKKLMFNLFMKKKIANWFLGSLGKLNEYCQGLVKEGKGHSSRIIIDRA